jgi:hypothetical protein
VLASRLATLDPADHPTPADLRRLWGSAYAPVPTPGASAVAPVGDHPGTRGRSWLDALSGGVTPERSSRRSCRRRRTPPATSPWFPIPTTGSIAPVRDRSG